MSIKETLINRFLGGRIQQSAEQLVAAQLPALVETAVQERLPAATAATFDDTQWRRISGNSSRELPVATWQRQVEVCYWLWKTNPLANWIIETLTVFVAGKGFTYTAENEDVKALLDSFYFDPVNRMNLRFKHKNRELSLFGVQCWPVFVAEQTGRVRLGMVDPANIARIYCDPENAEIQIGVQVQIPEIGKTRFLRTILIGETETVVSETARQMREEQFVDGECFLFSINRVSNDPYGTSDIFVLADWLDEYEEFVYNYSRKARKQNAFIWDVTVDGADDKRCQQVAEDYAVKGDGELRVHNEKMKWEAKAPNLQAIEIKESASVFRNHILGNKSIPEHWYGGGGDMNRNTASESNEPFFALIDDRQELAKEILETIFTYVITRAAEARYAVTSVPQDELFAFAVQKPEVTNKDVTKIAAAIQQIITAMVSASMQGWLDKDNAVKMFAFIIALIGYELDPQDVLDSDPTYQDYEKGKTGPDLSDKTKHGPM